MKKINIKDIYVPASFRGTKPGENKMKAVREYLRENGKLDRPVVLADNILVDGYIRYLVAIEAGMDHIPYISVFDQQKQRNEVVPVYICGKFEGNDKEYTWRVAKRMTVEVGDKVQVKSKCKNGSNTAVVTVTKVFTSDDEKLLRHKPVVKKLKGASAKKQAGD